MHDLTKMIEEINLQISDGVKRQEFDRLQELLDKRLAYISELISYSISQEELRSFLNVIKSHDHEIIQRLRKDQDETREVFLNFNHIKHYIG